MTTSGFICHWINNGLNDYTYFRKGTFTFTFKFQIGNLWDPNYGILACIVIKKAIAADNPSSGPLNNWARRGDGERRTKTADQESN